VNWVAIPRYRDSSMWLCSLACGHTDILNTSHGHDRLVCPECGTWRTIRSTRRVFPGQLDFARLW